MRLILPLFFLLISSAFAQSPQALIRDVCPFCQVVNSETILFPIDGQWLKMRLIRADRERIAMKMISVSDGNGRELRDNIIFPNERVRYAFMESLRVACKRFEGYTYNSSGLKFSVGSYGSDPTIPTEAKVELTCGRDLSWVEWARSLNPFRAPDTNPSILRNERQSGKYIILEPRRSRQGARTRSQ